jgi:hypothetical protein
MKAPTTIRQSLGVILIVIFSVFLILNPQDGQAQDSENSPPPEKFSREELAQMLAPIALYPDSLLSQVLMASTYPIEVIEADRWIKKNSDLKDEILDDALQAKDWDPSVKAMCHFPSILSLMSDRIAETTNIGNAFLAQEEEVMDMVQELRAKAYAQGNLTTTSQQKVVVEKETIIIESANPKVYYVPYYDPFYIYGPWWYPAYPPYYWGPPGVTVGIGISYWPALYFGFAFGGWSYFDWHRHSIYIDVKRRPRYVHYDRWIAKPGPWVHVPQHRRGVAYRDKPTAVKYGQYPYRTKGYRPETRGFPEQGDRQGRVDDRTRRSPGARIDQPQGERLQQERQSVNIESQQRDRVRIDQRNQRTSGQERQPNRLEQQERTRIDTEMPARQRVETDSQRQKQMTQERSTPDFGVREQQERTRIDTEMPARQRAETDSQRQKQMTQEKSTPDFGVRQQQERTRIDTEMPARQRVETDRQRQKQMAQERSTPDFGVRQQPQSSRENVFNWIEDGRTENQSSSRGRSSRQGLSHDAGGNKSRQGDWNRGGHDGQSPGRR